MILLKTMIRKSLALIFVAFVLCMAGCIGLDPEYKAKKTKGTYVVREGDTLYSIAFRFGLDYKSLARINRISSPYTIYLDQKIALENVSMVPPEDYGPDQKSFPPKEKKAKKRKKTLKKNKPSRLDWQWPLKGKITSGFSLSKPVNKGIDIEAKKGSPVLAAAGGIVVYAGGNLRGYGKLVILKHENDYLSAYGNNESIAVSEGDVISSGTIISRVGKSASNQEVLHFEIRLDGKPVNPIRHLPRK